MLLRIDAQREGQIRARSAIFPCDAPDRSNRNPSARSMRKAHSPRTEAAAVFGTILCTIRASSQTIFFPDQVEIFKGVETGGDGAHARDHVGDRLSQPTLKLSLEIACTSIDNRRRPVLSIARPAIFLHPSRVQACPGKVENKFFPTHPLLVGERKADRLFHTRMARSAHASICSAAPGE